MFGNDTFKKFFRILKFLLEEINNRTLNEELKLKEKKLEEKKLQKKQRQKRELRDVILIEDVINIVSSTRNAKNLNKAEFRVGITLLFFLGIRISEFKQISIIGFKNSLNHVEPLAITPGKAKTSVKMYHYITPKIKEYILEICGDDVKSLFSTKADTEFLLPFSREYITRSLNKILKSYGTLCGKNFLSNSCRISFITRITSMFGIQEAQEMIGHQNLTTTQRYNHYKTNLEHRLKVMDCIFEKPKTLHHKKRGPKSKQIF